MLGATGSALGWGIIRGRHDFERTELPVRIYGLPRALDGYTILQISDIHTGTFVDEELLDEGLSLVRSARSDLTVVTGDLVDLDGAYAPLVARKLAELRSRDGLAIILGNHDYYADPDDVRAALRVHGLEVMINAGRVIRGQDGGGFALLGVDDLSGVGRGGPGPDLDRALADVPHDIPRILLSHQPRTIHRWEGRVALQLSGHTHGAQVDPGGMLKAVVPYLAGKYEVGGTTLYVNRGFGTSALPARVGVAPEITRIVLVAG